MREQPNRPDRESEHRAQRLVMLQLLDGDHDRWTLQELENELATLERTTLKDALVHLTDAGLVHITGGVVRPALAALHLSELDLIAL